MNQRYSLIVIIMIIRMYSFAQNKQTKVVVDSKTRLPLGFVNIYSEDKKNSQLSDKKGNFTINFDLDHLAYIFNKTGYFIQSISQPNLEKRDTVFLIERPVQLNEVDIVAKTLEEVVKDKRFYVNDYLVLPNSDFLILTYKIYIKGFEISYYKKDRGITCTKRITDELEERLFKDCFSNYHLVTDASSRQLYFPTDSSFEFLPSFRRTYFDSTLARVVLQLDSQFIYKSEMPPKTVKEIYFDTDMNSPYLTYMSSFRRKRQELYTVVYNKEMREMLNSEIGDARMKYRTVKEIGGRNSSIQSVEASNHFFIETAVGPIYAPIYKKNDTLVVLNFQEDEIVFLARNGTVLNRVKIEEYSKYHHFEAYYDEGKQFFYVTQSEFDTHQMKRLNIYTGKFDRVIHFERPFPKNIQITNNKMYFQVKEHDWDDTFYIYLQNL